MNILTDVELKKLSFPDCVVEEMIIDVKNKNFMIETDDGFLAVNNGIKLKSCKLTIKNWHSASAMMYLAKMQQWEKLNIETLEKLEDICEFEYGNDIILRGFGKKTCQWIQIIFSQAKLEVEYRKRE